MYGILDSSNSEPEGPRIDDLRQEVDRIDNEILSLLASRNSVARRIADNKSLTRTPFRDDSREQKVILERLAAAKDHSLNPDLVSRLWEQIMADSLRVQFEHAQQAESGTNSEVTIAIQGVDGSNSHRAALSLTPTVEKRSWVSCDRFSEVVAAVKEGRADLGVLPIENTTSGAIAEVYDQLLDTKLTIVGEVKVKVVHCLLGVPGSQLADLKTIHGHPQAVAQCAEFLSELKNVEVVYTTDTAKSAQRIAEINNPTVAAIAGQQAADLFGLDVIEDEINTRTSNQTRFVAVSLTPVPVAENVPAKTSVVLTVSNDAGALAKVLDVFAKASIPLVKLESRPLLEDPWQELFYLDLEGNRADPHVASALAAVKTHTSYLRILGTYPSTDLRPHRVETPSAPLQVREIAVDRKPSPASSARLAERSEQGRDTIVDVRGVAFGGDQLVMIAGPCSVESEDQVMSTARVVKESGANVLRGGCFKPRTSPYSFQGLGWEGVELLAEAGRIYDLPVVTEVGAPEHVERMADMVDVLQIGARNMQNFALLSEVGLVNKPVLLKRGLSASIDELLQAAEYILAGGNQRVILCERGIRTFETAARNTLDVTAVPVLQRRSHLPVIVDPSHAAGDRDLVHPLAMAAVGAGAHGLMVEVHPDPDQALSDGPQSLTHDGLARLMSRLAA